MFVVDVAKSYVSSVFPLFCLMILEQSFEDFSNTKMAGKVILYDNSA